MKLRIFLLAAMLFSALNVASDDFSGRYVTDLNGTPSTLDLQREDNAVSGKLDAGGYLYRIEGRLVEAQLQGTLTDVQTGAVAQVGARLEKGSRLSMQVLMPGQYQPLQLTFVRPGTQGNQQQATQTPQGADRGYQDPALVGRWRYSESYTSGEFGGAYQEMLTIYPDGRYSIGEGQFAGGGPGVGGQSGVGGSAGGFWKAENRLLYVREAENQPWQPYCRYYVEGNSMMFTFGNGKRQVWKRLY